MASCVNPAANTLTENIRLNNRVSGMNLKIFLFIEIPSFFTYLCYIISIAYKDKK